jgi:hypothetical protein
VPLLFAWIRKLESYSFGVGLNDIWVTSQNACMLNIYIWVKKIKKESFLGFEHNNNNKNNTVD